MARAALACGVIALVLAALRFGLRLCSRRWIVCASRPRLVTVLETTFLPNAVSLHVIRVGAGYALVGSSPGHVALLADVPAQQVEEWLSGPARPSFSAAWARVARSRPRRRA